MNRIFFRKIKEYSVNYYDETDSCEDCLLSRVIFEGLREETDEIDGSPCYRRMATLLRKLELNHSEYVKYTDILSKVENDYDNGRYFDCKRINDDILSKIKQKFDNFNDLEIE